MNGGKLLRRAVGMTWQNWQQANKACRTRPLQATQPADSPPGTGLKTNSQQLAGLAAKTIAAGDVGLPLAVQCRWVGGVQWCWQPGRRAQTYLLSLPHLSPLPVTVPTHSLNLKNPI